MKRAQCAIVLSGIMLTFISCRPGKSGSGFSTPSATREILLTAESGAKMARQKNVPFIEGIPRGTVIQIMPQREKQTIDGIGTSFTESAAFVLAHLPEVKRREVMEALFSTKGADFSLTRTHIGACDFSVEGKYSYADTPGDTDLDHFSIAEDKKGLTREQYPEIVDESYDLLPMIQEALAVKRDLSEEELRIIASAWTAPAWMKDIDDWYVPGSPENSWQGTGGSLKPQYVPVYAGYLMRYLRAYAEEGVDIWGITPVNEPQGNGGQWESMHFTPETQKEFIAVHLGPRLRSEGRGDVRLLIYDQNRDHLEHWADVILGDPPAAEFIYGTAVHWYASTEKVYENALERVHELFPDFAILHSEGCIDNLGLKAGGGITDPDGYQESGWFDNDAFWWNRTASDWAYTATWAGEAAKDHPMYTPVHRYARNIIVSLDHWITGWVDWNAVLDRNGGPNHAGNFCGAPIMIDTETGEVYYTPIYYVLAQFSRTIRPGDRVVRTLQRSGALPADALHACATLNDTNLLSVQLLNTTKSEIPCALQIGERFTALTIPPNAVETVRVQL